MSLPTILVMVHYYTFCSKEEGILKTRGASSRRCGAEVYLTLFENWKKCLGFGKKAPISDVSFKLPF